MPKYKGAFSEPAYYQHIIVDDDKKKIGTLRIKPNKILWKPSRGTQFYSVDLETFTKWISDPKTEAGRGDR